MANAAPDAKPRRIAALELTALGAVLALFSADLLRAPEGAVAAIASVAALVHAMRLVLWRPWKVGARPILWILHAAYAWIVVHLALRALAAIGSVPMSIADHALTVGGIGALWVAAFALLVTVFWPIDRGAAAHRRSHRLIEVVCRTVRCAASQIAFRRRVRDDVPELKIPTAA